MGAAFVHDKVCVCKATYYLCSVYGGTAAIQSRTNLCFIVSILLLKPNSCRALYTPLRIRYPWSIVYIVRLFTQEIALSRLRQVRSNVRCAPLSCHLSRVALENLKWLALLCGHLPRGAIYQRVRWADMTACRFRHHYPVP